MPSLTTLLFCAACVIALLTSIPSWLVLHEAEEMISESSVQQAAAESYPSDTTSELRQTLTPSAELMLRPLQLITDVMGALRRFFLPSETAIDRKAVQLMGLMNAATHKDPQEEQTVDQILDTLRRLETVREMRRVRSVSEEVNQILLEIKERRGEGVATIATAEEQLPNRQDQ